MQPIRLAFTDTDQFIHPALLRILQSHFDIVVDEDDPQFVIFSIYPGFDFLKYPNAIRIFQSEESTLPDFNLCDFAFGYAHIGFDRYMRLPNYFFFPNFHELKAANRSTGSGAERDRFCNYIYSNLHPHPMRAQLFHALDGYKRLHSHGRHLNNAEPLDTPTSTEGWNEAKLRVQRRYKFTIVAENSPVSGYTTEKMTDALSTHTVPIYWGNPDVALDFNPERFVNVHAFASLDEVVAEVRRLDEDGEAYARMLAQPIFTPDNLARAPTEESIVAFMRRVFGHAEPVRNRVFWGAWYEERIRGLLADRQHLAKAQQDLNRLHEIHGAAEADRSRLAQIEHDQRGRISELRVCISELESRLASGSPGLMNRLRAFIRHRLAGFRRR